ncbi:MAG: hypothetical protein P1S60_09375, partial [Anaerolineae bacterium]|nr:hypothetical protein [Anaerolineae bacterium]
PRANKIALAGAVLGLALAAKVSSLPLFMISSMWILVKVISQQWTIKKGLQWGLVYAGSAALVLWAGNLFQVKVLSHFPWLLPAPKYWESLRRITQHIVTEDRYSFLLGHTYRGGNWIYFPVTFGLKTPVCALLLICVTLISIPFIWKKVRQQAIYLMFYPVLYVIISLSGTLNLGYRYLLPLMPFVYLNTSYIWHSLRSSAWNRYVFGFAALAQIFTAALSWPNYLPYFNFIAGGSGNGYHYLADSNVDWGQALKAVYQYVKQNEIESPYISAFTPFIDPSRSYGIHAQLLPPLRGEDVPLVLPRKYNPIPGHYLISASTLRGLQIVDPEMYNWFWHRKPIKVIAGAMLHYDVEALHPEPRWVVQCSQPVAPLSMADIAFGFGVANLRVVTFDCTQSWLYPDSGQYPGWAILHSEVDEEHESFINDRLADFSISFEKKIKREVPTHTVYLYQKNEMTLQHNQSHLWVAPGELAPYQAIENGAAADVPINVDNHLALIGVYIQVTGQSVILQTTWRVLDLLNAPFSLMAHLVDSQNNTIAVGDSIGIPFSALLPGDTFVQKHVLGLPQAKVAEMWIQTGVYRLDTLERLPVLGGLSGQGDHVLIELDGMP